MSSIIFKRTEVWTASVHCSQMSTRLVSEAVNLYIMYRENELRELYASADIPFDEFFSMFSVSATVAVFPPTAEDNDCYRVSISVTIDQHNQSVLMPVGNIYNIVAKEYLQSWNFQQGTAKSGSVSTPVQTEPLPS